MGIIPQLILTAGIVNFGLTFAELHIQLRDQDVISKVNLNNKTEERKRFQNIFDSITKNDAKKSEVYREVLKNEAGKEKQVFDAMKEELWGAQNRNADRRRNAYKNGGIRGDVRAVKRETSDESDVDDEARDFTSVNKQRDGNKIAMVHREDCFRFLYFDHEGVVMNNVIGLEYTNKLATGGVEKEAEAIFRNAKTVLEKNGSLLEYVYSVAFKLANINDTQIVDEVFKKYFKPPYPKKSFKQAKRPLPLWAKVEAEISANMTVEQLIKNPDDHI